METTSGRAGNDLASALSHLLNNILPKYPAIEYMWSDSCVAQNRDQLLSYAQQLYLQSNTRIKSITHRYFEPVHSNIGYKMPTTYFQISSVLGIKLCNRYFGSISFFCWLSPSHTTTKNSSLKNLKLQNWLILSNRGCELVLNCYSNDTYHIFAISWYKIRSSLIHFAIKLELVQYCFSVCINLLSILCARSATS